MLQTLLRTLGWLLLSVLGLVFLVYAVLSAILYATESQWVSEPPFHPAIDVRSDQPHQLTLIDSGPHSLAARLALIRSAQHTLDLEFFIYDLDDSSRIISRALVNRAQAGVQVRVLVDFSQPVFELRPAYAAALVAQGIDVRYYNTASIARLFSVQHRNHRKILVADSKRAIVGGRNIADDYFGLSEHYNFLDSDVLIEGEVVTGLQESFDLYWTSQWSEQPTLDSQDTPTIDFLGGPAEKIAQARGSALLQNLGSDAATHTCHDTQFVTDYPGAGVNHRRVYPALAAALGTARNEIVAESPYFVLQGDGLTLTQQLTTAGVSLRVLTNSLYATDAYYTVAPLYLSLDKLSAIGLTLYAYNGDPPTPIVRAKRWGVHSKRAVVDDSTIVIGTYNVDPRSANLNAELIVICRGNEPLATQMRADIEARIARSALVVAPDQTRPANLLGAASRTSILKMWLIAPLASLFSFLL